METKVLSFRMPLGWPAQLNNAARKYHFSSLSEMLRLVITEAVHNSLRGKLKVKGNIVPPTSIIACRLPVSTLEAITTVCCKQIKNTASTWAAVAVYQWYQALIKEDSKQQRNAIGYTFFLQDYAKNYRNKVSVYNSI